MVVQYPELDKNPELWEKTRYFMRQILGETTKQMLLNDDKRITQLQNETEGPQDLAKLQQKVIIIPECVEELCFP
jgi:hypothetical protein